MKIIFLMIVPAALLFVACSSNSDAGKAATVTDSTHFANAYDSLNNSDGTLDKEISEYRDKISKKLDEIDAELDQVRERLKAEKNAERQREYEREISEREKNKQSLREKLDEMDAYITAKWEDFKKDVNELFEKDKADHPETNNKK